MIWLHIRFMNEKGRQCYLRCCMLHNNLLTEIMNHSAIVVHSYFVVTVLEQMAEILLRFMDFIKLQGFCQIFGPFIRMQSSLISALRADFNRRPRNWVASLACYLGIGSPCLALKRMIISDFVLCPKKRKISFSDWKCSVHPTIEMAYSDGWR